MTWPSRTFFKRMSGTAPSLSRLCKSRYSQDPDSEPRESSSGCLLVLLLSLAAAANLVAGSVSGRVELRDSQDAAVRKRMDFSGVVVWLEPVTGSPAPAAPGALAKMIQKDKTFTPHVLPIRVGTRVDFPNFDPIFHNAFSNYNGQLFDVGLYPPGTSRRVRFARPGVVRVFCNIHAAMSAVIVVLNTPYFETTPKNGSFQLNNIPPGEYALRLFHERATQATLDSLTRRVTVTEGSVTLPVIGISESGYIVIPHHNKYGHDYTDPPADNGVYPAVRK
jgi:plastocyanin